MGRNLDILHLVDFESLRKDTRSLGLFKIGQGRQNVNSPGPDFLFREVVSFGTDSETFPLFRSKVAGVDFSWHRSSFFRYIIITLFSRARKLRTHGGDYDF